MQGAGLKKIVADSVLWHGATTVIYVFAFGWNSSLFTLIQIKLIWKSNINTLKLKFFKYNL